MYTWQGLRLPLSRQTFHLHSDEDPGHAPHSHQSFQMNHAFRAPASCERLVGTVCRLSTSRTHFSTHASANRGGPMTRLPPPINPSLTSRYGYGAIDVRATYAHLPC